MKIQIQRRAVIKKIAAAIAFGGSVAMLPCVADAAVGKPEKWELKFGFIKLTDMVPLAVAYEKGYFEDEGLFVTLEAQANWKVLQCRPVRRQEY